MTSQVLSLTRLEWFKLRHRRMPWILLGIAVLLVQVAFWGSYALFRSGQMTAGQVGEQGSVSVSTDERFLELFAFPTSLTNGLIVAHGFGGILLMILAASLMGSEYGWGTLRTVLTKGTGRWPLLTAKLLLLAGAERRRADRRDRFGGRQQRHRLGHAGRKLGLVLRRLVGSWHRVRQGHLRHAAVRCAGRFRGGRDLVLGRRHRHIPGLLLRRVDPGRRAGPVRLVRGRRRLRPGSSRQRVGAD